MYNILLFVDRVKSRVLSIYRKKVFLGRTNNSTRSLTILGKVYLNATNVKLGENVTIYPNVYFWGDGLIEIGDNVDLGIGTVIFSKKSVKIGNNTSIAGYCYIIDSNHGTKKGVLINSQALELSNEGIFIGEDVWIGAGCKIIKGAKINNGAVIGAMSMVNSEIDEFGIAVGLPAKVIKYRL